MKISKVFIIISSLFWQLQQVAFGISENLDQTSFSTFATFLSYLEYYQTTVYAPEILSSEETSRIELHILSFYFRTFNPVLHARDELFTQKNFMRRKKILKAKRNLIVAITTSSRLNSYDTQIMKQLQYIRYLLNVDEDYVVVIYPWSNDINLTDLKVFRKKSQQYFIEANHYPENLIFFEWNPAIGEINRIFVTQLYCSTRQEMCLREETLPEKRLGPFSDAQVQQFESKFKRSSLIRYNYNEAPLHFVISANELQTLPSFLIIKNMPFRDVIKFSVDLSNRNEALEFSKKVLFPIARLVIDIVGHLNGTATTAIEGIRVGGGIIPNSIIHVTPDNRVFSKKFFVTEYERYGFVYCINGTSSMSMNLLSVFHPLDIFTWLLVLVVIAAGAVIMKGSGNLLDSIFDVFRTVLLQPSLYLTKFAGLLLLWNFMMIFLSNGYSGSIESLLVVSGKPYIFKDFEELDRNQYRFVVTNSSPNVAHILKGAKHLDRLQNSTDVQLHLDFTEPNLYEYLAKNEKRCVLELDYAVGSVADIMHGLKHDVSCFKGKRSLANYYAGWSFIYPNGNILYRISHSWFTTGIIGYFVNNYLTQETIFIKKYSTAAFNISLNAKPVEASESLSMVKVSGIFYLWLITLWTSLVSFCGELLKKGARYRCNCRGEKWVPEEGPRRIRSNWM
ncbi:unnamed protein product [Allacma fusca]|uniref:Uncharacterized protein n=1 Tax=Allacma fusca TaxID=39272 RepID=A0A8J2KCB3_9HEXA|nr:unnamed protein product [Allacma fusca]